MRLGQEMLSLELCKASGSDIVSGKLVVNIATDNLVAMQKAFINEKLHHVLSQPSMCSYSRRCGRCAIFVRRSNIFDDAYEEIMQRNSSDLKQQLLIMFRGEDNLDPDSISKDFFFSLSKAMFNPEYW
jgi:E3 ubiquitin-protein ligase NEDD4